MTNITGVRIVEENAGFSNSLVATWVATDGTIKGVVVAWNVDDHVGTEISIPEGLIPEGVDVSFGVIPDGARNSNPTDTITDVASAGAGASVFTIEGSGSKVTFDGQQITGWGADLLLQSEVKNPDRPAGEEFGDADDFVANDESGSDDATDQEVTPTSATAAAGERDLNADPLTGQQIGFEDLVKGTDADFNDLIIEVVREDAPPPPPEDETRPISVEPPEDGGPAVTVETEFERTEDIIDIDALFSTTISGSGIVNIALIMDVSGSTGSPLDPLLVTDVNGNSRTEFIDAEFEGLQAVSDFIADEGFDEFDFDLGFIQFASRAFLVNGVFDPGFDVFAAATADGQTGAGGGTNFERPLQQAISFFESVDPAGEEQNFVLFLSDGGASTGRLSDEIARLEGDFNATIKAVGFGSGASKPALDVIDSNNDASIIDDPTTLPSVLPDFLSPVSIASISLIVNGVLEETFGPDALSVVPGVGQLLEDAIVDTAVAGDGAADLIELEATDTNGDTNKITFFVGEQGAAETYTLDAPIDPAPFIVGFNADQGDELVLSFATNSLTLIETADSDGDDFALENDGTVVVEFIDTIGVSGVDDLFGAVA